MPVVKLRERGQLTIPYEYRKELGIGKKDALNVLKIGDAFVLVPRQLSGDVLSKKIEASVNTRRPKGIIKSLTKYSEKPSGMTIPIQKP